MLQLQNAKERDADDWIQLFLDTDPRFKVLVIKQPQFSKLGIIEAIWDST